jgi:spore maturation protein A
MLNYIWLTLILLGTGVAVWSDWRDASTDRYHNGAVVECRILEDAGGAGDGAPTGGIAQITVEAAAFDAAYAGDAGYGGAIGGDIMLQARCLSTFPPAGQAGSVGVEIPLGPDAPQAWREIQAGQKTDGFLRGTLRTDGSGRWTLEADPVRFVRLNAVTNDGIVKYAKVAVELAIGLIGIMSLWLGLMKIAEQAGMVAVLAKFLKPVTTRLFPDVPADHPAMGAMLMNISANMLGLANAATPLGLKAMEELNKLNKKLGTATDAMCTFLVINTSSVQLIPATVIAIRAASGSSNPTEIIGPVIFATTINTVVGIAAVKLLARLRIFRAAAEGGKA